MGVCYYLSHSRQVERKISYNHLQILKRARGRIVNLFKNSLTHSFLLIRRRLLPQNECVIL